MLRRRSPGPKPVRAPAWLLTGPLVWPLTWALVLTLTWALACAQWALPAPAAAATGERWTLRGADAIGAAVAVSRFSFPQGAQAAVLARADQFPDALASGLLQREGPLLLTATGELSAATAAELTRLGVTRVTVLGGTSAVTDTVLASLRAAGYTVSRIAGPSRVDTAVAVASARTASRTVLLARAGGGTDPTQAFADALAAGAWSAASGYPVLLTDSAGLSAATAAYLTRAGVRTVMLVGGTGALSAAVERDLLARGIGVRRISGAERTATAVAVARTQGFDSAAKVDRTVLVDGRGTLAWAAGFAAASLARDGRTALLLSEADSLPAATRAFLDGGAADVVCGPLLAAARCEDAADAAGLAEPTVGGFGETALAAVERDPEQARSFSLTVTGGGPVTVALVDAAIAGTGDGGWVLDDNGDGLADGLGEPEATVDSVPGTAITPAAEVTDLVPAGGRLSFTISAPEGGVAVRPVVYVDLDADGGLDVDGDGTPAEPAAVGGATVWVPPDARAGSHANQVLTQVWPSLGLATTATATFRWDTGDSYAYNSGVTAALSLSRSQFESMVGAGDTLAVNVGSSSTRLTIVRDVPAAPGGVRAVATDTDGDGVDDVVRVTWQRPPNTDLAADNTYTVQQSTRTADGRWGGWTDGGEGEAVSDLSDDIDADEGEHRFRLLAINSSDDSSPAGRPVLVGFAPDADDTPPASIESEFTTGEAQPDENIVLDAGDSFTITFTGVVEADADAWLDLRDADGTLVRLTNDENAVFEIGGEGDAAGTVLTVSVTGPPDERSGSEGDDDPHVEDFVVVEAAEGIGNDAGEWNLPESGWDGGDDERSRMVVGDNGDLPEPLAEDEITADAGLGEVTIVANATGIEDGDAFAVYDHSGERIARGTYDATGGTTVETDDFAEGERIYVIYVDDDGLSLPSGTAALVVPSPRPVLEEAEGTGDSIVLLFDEDVDLVGDGHDVRVYDEDDRVLVAEGDQAEQAGADRIVVELDEDLTTGTTYTVRIGDGLVEDEAEDENDAQTITFTAAAAAPALTVASGPANGSTVATASVTWTGAAADTVGVVDAVQRRVDGGDWVTTDVTADVPDDGVSWSVTLTFADGAHTVELRAVDNNGTASAVTERAITVDTTP